MYLSLLSTEQKKLFISIAFNLADSDGEFSKNEKQVIESYSKEMEMTIKREEVDTDMNRVISNINAICSVREKKIIVFEMIGLAMADSNYDEGERKIVRDVLSVFGLEHTYADYCEKKLSEYFELQHELNESVLS